MQSGQIQKSSKQHMIPTIEHNKNVYPQFQSKGFAAKFAFPFAQQVCRGNGYDIGGNRLQWAYKDADGKSAMLIDPLYSEKYDAYNLPFESGKPLKVDYIFSSHCLEHLPNWVQALDYWHSVLHKGGVLFLYLPDYSQSYWRPWHNTKHVHVLTPQMLRDYLTDRGWQNIFVSNTDLNNSFMVMANKAA